jgi:hypothetical protein
MLYTYKCTNEECPNDLMDVEWTLEERQKIVDGGGYACPVCHKYMVYQFFPVMHLGEKVKPKSDPKLSVRLK